VHERPLRANTGYDLKVAFDLLKALGHRPSRRGGNVVVGQQLGYVARAFRLKTFTAQNAGNKLHYEPVFAANVNKGDANSCSSPASARCGGEACARTTVQCVARDPSYEIVQITPDFGTV